MIIFIRELKKEKKLYPVKKPGLENVLIAAVFTDKKDDFQNYFRVSYVAIKVENREIYMYGLLEQLMVDQEKERNFEATACYRHR